MKRNGFTLIELLVAIFIIGILVTIIFSSGGGTIYKLVSKQTYTGTIDTIQNLTPSMALQSRDQSLTYSFAIDLSTPTEIISFSSEDRQFGIIKPKDSVTVAVFKYAPWHFSKAGTLYGGRLLKRYKK
jgi:prepilin-type N-terminal cleavage/methylation domain-containing protein